MESPADAGSLHNGGGHLPPIPTPGRGQAAGGWRDPGPSGSWGDSREGPSKSRTPPLCSALELCLLQHKGVNQGMPRWSHTRRGLFTSLGYTHVHEMGESHRDSPVSSESASLQSWPLTTAVCCSVAKSRLTLCNPTGCSMSGFSVLHHLPELLKLMSIESLMPSNHLILCHPPSSCPQSFPASRSFPMSQLFTSGGQSTGTSASATVLSMNIQGWFPLGLTGLISL